MRDLLLGILLLEGKVKMTTSSGATKQTKVLC
jgi:hypothetical protein